jgi:hypothetical protein
VSDTLKIRCERHGDVEIPAAGVVLTWTAAGAPSGRWVARANCPVSAHRVGADGLSTGVVRALVAAGARYVQAPAPFRALTFPCQYRPADVRDPMTAEDVEALIDELYATVDLSGHAASEQRVVDARRRRAGGAR